ncbi:MAG TPA: hypothetical protein VJV79_25015 [Polyangiaceae bacterium]|nr:hypothetical protein [Polyangiaceae bacterium]
MAKVDFWALTRPVQERFVASTEGAAAPAPLAIRPLARDARSLAYSAFGIFAALAGFALLRVGFGDLSSRYALAPATFIALYSGCFALAAVGFFMAAVRYVKAYSVPYHPALYLYPIGVIDARSPEFMVHRITEQTEARFDPARSSLRIELEGVHFEFPAADASQAEQAAATVLGLRDKLANSGPESSAREQSLVDPLIDNGFKNPFAPAEPLRKALPGWVKTWPIFALFLGVLLGGAAFLVRNHLSEGRLYAAARSADSTEAYRTYLARGGRNPDVQALLLPRAELRDAERSGNVADIERYLDSHADTPIKIEVEAALQKALLEELAVAEAKGTLSALKEFGAKYARYSFLASSIERAVNARIDTALRQLKPTLAANQTRLLPFMERLLRYTAQHGPQLLVRFQRKPTETLVLAEKALRQSAYFSGEKTLPGHFFDDAHQAPREAAMATALIAELAAHFPRDLVDAQPGSALDAAAEAKATVPTILVTYHTEFSGAFPSRKPRLALSGIGVLTRISFDIPGDPEPLVFKLTVWRAPDLRTITDTSNAADLYETMAGEAFKRSTKKYLATLFVER